jgi:hypothetical protein
METTDDGLPGFTGEFYANDFGPANLDLLAAFYEKYPDYADKTFLSVKVLSLLRYPGRCVAGRRTNGLTVA